MEVAQPISEALSKGQALNTSLHSYNSHWLAPYANGLSPQNLHLSAVTVEATTMNPISLWQDKEKKSAYIENVHEPSMTGLTMTFQSPKIDKM